MTYGRGVYFYGETFMGWYCYRYSCKFFKTCNISNDLDSDGDNVNDGHDDTTDFIIGEDDIIDIIGETDITD